MINKIGKYKVAIIIGLIYSIMYVNYYFAVLLLVVIFQFAITVSAYRKLVHILRFKKDTSVKGTVLALREVEGDLEKYYKYEYLVEFEWEKRKYTTRYQFSSFFKPSFENKTLDVWVDESNPEGSVVTESSGYRNRWFILFDSFFIFTALLAIEYFILKKIF